MDQASEELQPIVFELLAKEKQLWYCADNIEYKCPCYVIVRNCIDILMSPCLFDKIKNDLKEVYYVNYILDLLQGLLPWCFLIICISVSVVIHINIWEDHDKRGNEQAIDDQAGYHEVPQFAECSLSIYKVPFDLLLVLIDLVIFVGILVNIVDHHFFQV